MIGTPRFLTTFWHTEAFGQGIKPLETEFARDMSLVFRKDLCTELFFEVFTDDPYDLAESSLDGVVDTVVHDGFAVGAQTIELFQASVAASHACCKQKKSRFHMQIICFFTDLAAKIRIFGE